MQWKSKYWALMSLVVRQIAKRTQSLTEEVLTKRYERNNRVTVRDQAQAKCYGGGVQQQSDVMLNSLEESTDPA